MFVAEKAESVAEEIKQAGGQALAVPGDMLDDAYLPQLVQKAADFGNGKLHIIVNNAGFTWDAVIHKVRIAYPTHHHPLVQKHKS